MRDHVDNATPEDAESMQVARSFSASVGKYGRVPTTGLQMRPNPCWIVEEQSAPTSG
jgi:hypothetical protein